jgi:hypothetical protein
MTNKDHYFWVVLLFSSVVCIFGYGCATTPKSDDQSSYNDENKSSPFLSSGSFDKSESSGVVDKKENDRSRSEPDPVESGSKPQENALPDQSTNQLTDTSEESDPVVSLDDGNLDPVPSAEIERRGEPFAFPESGSRSEEAGQADSRSPFNQDAEGGELSDSVNTLKPTILGHDEEDPQSNSPAFSTVPGKDEGEGRHAEDESIFSPNLAKPFDPSKPLFPDLPKTRNPSDKFDLRSTDENPGISSFDESDTVPDSGLKIGNSTQVSLAPSLPASPSPQISQKVAGEDELPPAFSEGVREGGDSPDDSDLKVAFSGEEKEVVPPPLAGATPSVRFFDRINVGGNRAESGNAKTLGFSDRRPNSRFLKRGSDSSSKNVFQPSVKPNDYNSLKNFLSNRNKLDTGGTWGVPSAGNYPEAEKFLESIDSSKSDESSPLREDGTSPDDARYQNALEWLRSRGQGVELQN